MGTVAAAALARTVADAWARGLGPQFTADVTQLASGQLFGLCSHRHGTHEEEGSEKERKESVDQLHLDFVVEGKGKRSFVAM